MTYPQVWLWRLSDFEMIAKQQEAVYCCPWTRPTCYPTTRQAAMDVDVFGEGEGGGESGGAGYAGVRVAAPGNGGC